MAHLNLIDLPDVVLEHVFSFLTYDNIAHNRVVCTKFNILGGKMLNKGYFMADKFHSKTLKSIKSKLPRRESERRVHPLARQCDILIAIETRLSMLSMTFAKWIEAKLCCFIPGKVIDEIMRVLRCVAQNPSPPRAHEILQELRDISSMAMEHFDEKILPSLRMSLSLSTFITVPSRSSECLEAIVSKRICTNPVHNKEGYVTVTDFNKLIVRESINRKKIKAQSDLIAKQASDITELRRHVEEWEAKLRDLTQNLIKATDNDPDLPSSSSPIDPKRKRKSSTGALKLSKRLRSETARQ